MTHRSVELIDEGRLVECLARTPMDQYVIWMGGACGQRPGSLRARALRCIEKVGSPVPLRSLLRQAARLNGEEGLDPDLVRNAVRLHQSARPTAYFLVRRTCAGDYVAVTDIPVPAGGGKRINGGDVVVDRNGGFRTELRAVANDRRRPSVAGLARGR